MARCKGEFHGLLRVGAAVCLSLVLVGVVTAPVSAGAEPGGTRFEAWGHLAIGPATAGSPTATVAPSSVVAPTPTSLTLTFVAGETMTAGVVTVAVPTGWTPPSLVNSTSSMGTPSVVGSTITVNGVNLAIGQSLTVTYGVGQNTVAPPDVGGFVAFPMSWSATAVAPLTPLSSPPSVFVYAKTSPAVFQEVTTVPLAVFNDIRVQSKAIPVTPPTVNGFTTQRPFVARVNGVIVPRSFFWGFEWCPFCAPNVWSIVVALSRFGHFTQLYEMTSSPADYAPNAPSFTFHMSAYKSPYLAFTGYEVEGPTRAPLDRVPHAIQALLARDNPMMAAPFMDIGNHLFIQGAAFDPSRISTLSRNEIANHLRVTSNPVTRAVIASANYLSAGICGLNGQKPATVCDSAGVVAADKAMGIPVPSPRRHTRLLHHSS